MSVSGYDIRGVRGTIDGKIGFKEQVAGRLQRGGYSGGSIADSIRYIGQRIEWGDLETNQLL